MAVSFFDSIIEQTNPVVDAVFGKLFALRWNGRMITLTAILSAHPITLDEQGSQAESIHSHNFEINAADIDFGDGQMLPQPGMEFAEANADGTNTIYELTKALNGRCYDPLDSEETRLLLSAVQVRREPQ